MSTFFRSGRTRAAVAALSVLGLFSTGCKHCRKGSSCHEYEVGHCVTCSPEFEGTQAPPEASPESSTAESSWSPEANYAPAPRNNVALPPTAPPVPAELSTEFSNSAEVVPQRRNPFQTIKEKLSPVRNKVDGLFRGYETSSESGTEAQEQLFGEQPAVEEPPFADDLSESDFDAFDPEIVHPESLEDVAPSDSADESLFDELDSLDGLDEPLPQLDDESAQDDFLPPISENTLNTSDDEKLFPAPAPTPSLRPERLPYNPLEPSSEPTEGRFDAAAPQLLRAPRAELSSVNEGGTRFVPVSHEQLSGFAIPRMALCSTIRSYEDFDEINRGQLRRGQQVLIYNTLRDFSCVESQTEVRTLTHSHVEVVAVDGQVLSRKDLGEAPDTSRTKRRDYFLTHRFTVPTNLSPGFYRLRLAVEDMVGHQTAFKELAVRVE